MTEALDVTSDASVTSAINGIIAAEGKIDILINNAGYGMAGSLEMVSISEAKVLFHARCDLMHIILNAVMCINDANFNSGLI